MAADDSVKEDAGLQVRLSDLSPARKSVQVEVPATQVAG
jgi:hypothetical protein